MYNKQLQEYTKVKTGDYIVPIKDACEYDGKYPESYPLGYSLLDDAMRVKGEKDGGVRDGDLIIITGISGMGKSSLAQNISLNLNRIAIPSLWFSYEVNIDHFYAKFKEMGIDKDALIYAPKKNITGNLKWLKEKIKESQEKYHIKVVFIDHIDFLSPTETKSSDQKRMVLRDICQELKTLAIDQKIIIFLMAHVKKVQGREVEMQDLSESGALYQIPNFVLSIARNFKIDTIKGTDVKVPLNTGIVKILKNRLTGNLFYMNFEMKNNIIIPTI